MESSDIACQYGISEMDNVRSSQHTSSHPIPCCWSMNSTGLAKLLPVIFLFLMSVSHCQTLRNTLHLHSPMFPHILLPVQLPPMVLYTHCNSMCFSKNVSVWIEHAMCFLAWRASVYLIPWLTSGCASWEKAGCSERPLGRTAKEM